MSSATDSFDFAELGVINAGAENDDDAALANPTAVASRRPPVDIREEDIFRFDPTGKWIWKNVRA